MKCPKCEKEMQKGTVEVRDIRSLFNTSATVSWYSEKECTKKRKNVINLKLRADGYYCDECNNVVATFEEKGSEFSWIGKTNYEEMDTIEKKKCPKCGKEHDIDYPKCPFCKYKNDKSNFRW